MLKYLIVLLLLLIFFSYIFWRLRPYIEIARRIFGTVRDVRQVSRRDVAEPLRSSGKEGERLLRCASCETWIPSSRAVRLRTQSAAYCSHECLERAASAPQRARRSS